MAEAERRAAIEAVARALHEDEGGKGEPHWRHRVTAEKVLDVVDRVRDARGDEEALPWICPECGERHRTFDGECQDECNAELVRVRDARGDDEGPTGYTRVRNDELARLMLADAHADRLDNKAVERLTNELQALVDWFNEAPFLRAERLLYDLYLTSSAPADYGEIVSHHPEGPDQIVSPQGEDHETSDAVRERPIRHLPVNGPDDRQPNAPDRGQLRDAATPASGRGRSSEQGQDHET